MRRVARRPVNASPAKRKRRAPKDCTPAEFSFKLPPTKRRRGARKAGPLDGAWDEELERIWDTVRTGLEKVLHAISSSKDLSGRFSVFTKGEEWVRMYSEVAVLYGKGDPVRKRTIFHRVREFIRKFVNDQYAILENLCGTTLLNSYVRCWEEGLVLARVMKRVLLHIQKYWIAKNRTTNKDDPVGPLDSLLMLYWRENLLAKLPQIVETVLNEVDSVRRGERQDYSVLLLRRVILTFILLGDTELVPVGATPDGSSWRLGLYRLVFEEKYLDRTRKFYHLEAQRMLRGDDVWSFMMSVRKRLDEEAALSRGLLHEDSIEPLMTVVEAELVAYHQEYLQNEAEAMFVKGRENHLKQACSLLQTSEDGLVPVIELFSRHIQSQGSDILLSKPARLKDGTLNPHYLKVIDRIISLHERCSVMIKQCFDGAHCFAQARDRAFRKFLNEPLRDVTIAEVLARHVDHFLRRRKQSARSVQRNKRVPHWRSPEALRSQHADHIVRLVKYVKEKKAFFHFYRSFLCERLLSNYCEDAERDFLKELGAKFGMVYTRNLRSMYRDARLANEVNTNFRNSDMRDPDCPIDFSVSLLNSAHWPLAEKLNLAVPQVIENCLSRFSEHYLKRTSQQKLTWCHHQSIAEVQASFRNRSYSLLVSGIQAFALLCFNRSDRILSSELAKALGVEREVLDANLAPLVSKNILLTASVEESSDDARYEINTTFSARRRRIHIPIASQGPRGRRAIQGTNEIAQCDKVYLVDCELVRTMKTNKKITHNELVSKVTTRVATKFVPDVRLIKRRIECCIERDYMTRDPDALHVYEYVS